MSRLCYRIAASDSEVKGGFEVRRQVFAHEQGIPEALVFDDDDRDAMHIVVKDEGRVIATARVRFPEVKQAKLERMAVLKPFRQKGIGREIMSFPIQELKNKQVDKVVLHAQYGVVKFYKACGFNESGLPFWEAGIKHVKMEKKT